MLIGIDFDNTIVSYDALFYKVAREQNLIPHELPPKKIAVRDFLRKNDQEQLWTEMQGYVYGARMMEAFPFPGVLDFIQSATRNGHELMIISHKTKFPYAGPKYDLHASAKEWITTNLTYFTESRYFFEQSVSEKISRIAACQCDIFIDDLPEILLHEEFPGAVDKFLFDPEGSHAIENFKHLRIVNTWSSLTAIFS